MMTLHKIKNLKPNLVPETSLCTIISSHYNGKIKWLNKITSIIPYAFLIIKVPIHV